MMGVSLSFSILVQLPGDVEPLVLRRHHHVEQNDVRVLGLGLLDPFLAVGGRVDVVALGIEQIRDRLDELRIIINHQYLFRHRRFLLSFQQGVHCTPFPSPIVNLVIAGEGVRCTPYILQTSLQAVAPGVVHPSAHRSDHLLHAGRAGARIFA